MIPGEKTQVKPQDFLRVKAHCPCSQCELITEKVNPEITIDEELMRLQRNNHMQQPQCDLLMFFNKLRASGCVLPKFRFLDTIVMEGGEAAYAVYFQQGKAKIQEHPNIKKWLIERKEQLDLKYQVKKYERENKGFTFSAFEHKSEKKIKEFENNLRYKIPSILNRVAIFKMRGIADEVILCKNEFVDLFDLTKNKTHEFKQVEYVQVFPIMYGEQDHSYVRTIKYLREQEFRKKGFKLAEAYVLTWKDRNDSMEKLEEHVYEQIAAHEGLEAITEELKLLYQTYKLLIYFEDTTNLRIAEAVVHYITNDGGKTFFFKKVECARLQKRVSIEDIGHELPTKKDYAPEDHITLRTEMRRAFEGFQDQFQRLEKERMEMENKIAKDKETSSLVFATLTQKNPQNFHKILASKNQRYKKQQLKL